MTPERVTGVVPAAGLARRLGSPTSSKELIEAYRDPRDPGAAALPVCYRLLHAMHEAGISEALVVSRSDKADLRERLAGGSRETPDLRHLELAHSPSPAFSVATATRVAGPATIALGFPDVLWTAERAFPRLLERLAAGADIALGLFPPAENYPTVGVETDALGRVQGFHSPCERPRQAAWTLAVWRPRVSRFLEREVEAVARQPAGPELGLTEVFERALEGGFRIEGELLSAEPFLDIGDPARLAEALRGLERGKRRRPV